MCILGLAQGMVTGMRGLCNGVGPAMFGLIFYLFHVDLNEKKAPGSLHPANRTIDHIDSLPKVNIILFYLH